MSPRITASRSGTTEERGNTRPGEPNHPPEIVFAPTRKPLPAGEFDRSTGEAHPVHQPTRKSPSFAQAQQLINDLSVEQTKICRAGDSFDSAQEREDAIEQPSEVTR
jgi:hypothetical protein